MKALDTNVLARYLLNDDPIQSPLAVRQLTLPCHAPATVLLELAWLLTSRYRLDRDIVAKALDRLMEIPSLNISDPEAVAWAIDRFANGADIADMLHIATSGPADAFVTFERRMERLAGPDAPVPVERLG